MRQPIRFILIALVAIGMLFIIAGLVEVYRSFPREDYQLLQALGPILGGLALSASAVAAWSLFDLQRRQREEAWTESFRALHTAFWNDSDMAEVRKWIACDDAYAKAQPILSKRLGGQVAESEYSVLEKIDKFCALMTRIGQFSSRPMTNYQKTLWDKLYYSYWFTECKKRDDLKNYVVKYWPNLL